MSKYIKSRTFKEPPAKESFSFSTLFPIFNLMLSTYYMSLNAFLRKLSYSSQLKIKWILFSFSFFSQILQMFISSWRLYHLVAFIAKLWDDNLILVMAFLLLNLCKFRWLPFLKSSFFFVEKVVLFIFVSAKEGLDATVLSSFLEKPASFYIPSYLFHHSTPWIYSRLLWSLGFLQLSQAYSTAGLMVVSIRFKYVLTGFPSDFYKNRWSINHDFFALFIKLSIPWCFFPDGMNVNSRYVYRFTISISCP